MSNREETSKINQKIYSDNYLLNCYNHLIKKKQIHFLLLFIEMSLNIFQEFEIFINGFKLNSPANNKFILFNINNILEKISIVNKFLILISSIIIFDLLYIFMKIKKFNVKHIIINIIINVLEIFWFRAFSVIIFSLFFKLKKELFILGLIFIIPHIYLIINNFFNHHLYYFVPEFIDYPYDEFSSVFDTILMLSKLFLSAAGSISYIQLRQFFFLIFLLIQILFSIYFIMELKNHSYLFMKNSFLNKTRTSLFFTKTLIIIFSLLLDKNGLMNALFIIICIILMIIILSYMYFIYSPFLYIAIKRETPIENLIFYFFILSNKNSFSIGLEQKINEHYEVCGKCSICNKFINYLSKYKKIKINEENEKFIYEENDKNAFNNKDAFDNLFDVLYNNKNKYFNLMKKIIINYKIKGEKFFYKNSYYYINLSLLIYSDYLENNINLSLNERIILEVLCKENHTNLDNNKLQINQILLLNDFVSLSDKILKLMKDIVTSSNYYKGKKLIDLSGLLKKMEDKKFNKNLFNHKLENISNSKEIILICSVVYEEIFNKTLNNYQYPLRENFQAFENINIHKNSKLISLALYLGNKNCQIIRAGKELHSNLNKNLFDLFPLIFKQHQINLFIKNISDESENKNIESDKDLIILSNNLKAKSRKSVKKAIYENEIIRKEKIKDYFKIKLILSENISSKMNYKLLTLNLKVLFNDDNYLYIFFDGFYKINRNILISAINLEENMNAREKLIFISNKEMKNTKNVDLVSFKRYISQQEGLGFVISKIITINVSDTLYNIYNINKKERESELKKIEHQMNNTKNEDIGKSFIAESVKKHLNEYEDNNTNVSSQQTGSSSSNKASNLGFRNKKKNSIFQYGGFNKLQRFSLIVILITFCIYICEFYYLNHLFITTSNNYIALYQYREFYQLYYQLFSSILSVGCIYTNEKDCINLINIYQENYFRYNNDSNFFNFTLLVKIQNEKLVEKMMEKKKYLVNIHKDIGNKRYNELFGKNIEYLRITNNLTEDKSWRLNITPVTMQFTEAILIACNQFQSLTSQEKVPVFILDKAENPFQNRDNYLKDGITDIQKEFYEMVLNYKKYYDEFKAININLANSLNKKSGFSKIYIFISITIDTLILIIIATLIYLYNNIFEHMIVKVINYINMTINIKNDSFNFSAIFLKKLDNLEIILQFYYIDPIIIVKKLNSLYSKYQQFISSSKKRIDANNKKRKTMINDKDNDFDNIPKHQIVLTQKDVKFLKVNTIYRYIYYYNLLLILCINCMFIILFSIYFSRKNNIYNIMDKNTSVEVVIYRAINFYHIMLFQNYTVEEVNKNIFERIGKSKLFENFYYILELAFNNKKEKKKLGSFYKDFEDESNFTCTEFYNYNKDFIQEIENDTKAINLKNITGNLIKLCEYSKVSKYNDYRNVYELFFQYTKNGMISFNDLSYEGIIYYIKHIPYISTVSLYFNIFMIFMISIINTNPHTEAINRLIYNLKLLISSSEILFFLYYFGILLFSNFFYIPGINGLCEQIFMLKNIFKISENRE